MILITRIESEDLSPKIQAIISKNLVNNSISKILIFTNSKFKSNNKRIIVIEDGISDKDCIIKSKQIYPNEIFLWSNKWSNIFNTSLSKYDSKDNKETFYSSTDGEQNFIIFNPINFSPKFNKIIDCIHGRKIDVTNDNLFVKSIDTIKPNKDVNIQSDVIKKKGVKYVAPSVFLPVNKIDTIIVSVNYNDFLVLSLKYNKKYLQNITVVTSPDDKRCMEICEAFDVNCVITDKMYEDGAEFNKGRAINEGIKSIKDPDWILLLDADTILTEKIKIEPLETNTIYTSDRYYCYEYSTLNRWSNNEISLQQLGDKEIENGYGFFQLFNIRDIKNREKVYSEDYNDAAVSDTKFSESFEKKENLTSCIHLGRIRENWKGRISSAFISEEQINEIIKKQNETTICSYYFNFRNDPRQKENFIKFLSQFKGFYDKMIVGLIDYEDGGIDFDIPCKKIIIKGDKTNRLWSKELIINKIIENIDTGYIIWIDGDLIYEDLSWLNDINSIIKGNDFVQLFETINYLGENGEVLETHKSIISAGRNDVDELLKEGYKPGGSWLGKTSILKEKKLFDQMYVGGGDTIFVYGLFKYLQGWTLNKIKESNIEIYNNSISWIKTMGDYKVSYANLSINHLYHGTLKERNYNDRYKLLNSNIRYYSMVIPTMWKSDKIIQMLPIYDSCDFIKEIIIIDNAPKDKIDLSLYKKIKYYTSGNNIFVNPSWNKGFSMSSFELLLVNDDLLISLEKFHKILNLISNSELEVIGVDVNKFGDSYIEELSCAFPGNSFGCFMYIKNFKYIPEQLKIWYGDDVQYNFSKSRGIIRNANISTKKSETLNSNISEFRENIGQNDIKEFKILTNNQKSVETLNVIIRTSKRPKYFKTCVESIKKYVKSYKLHISIDNVEDLEYVKTILKDEEFSYYIIDKEKIVDICEKIHTTRNKFIYNYYYNIISDYLSGWCMYLDDDDQIVSTPEFDNDISKIFIHKVDIGKKIVPSKLKGRPKLNDISGISTIFHSSKIINWIPQRGGDFDFISSLYDVSDAVYVDKIIAKGISLDFCQELGGNFGNQTDIYIDKKVSVNLATYPPRKESLKSVIHNLMKNNIIDIIRVYMNEYEELPEDLPKCEKIIYHIGEENLMDSGKFFWANEKKDEYYFTIDDDLIYPQIYFIRHLGLLKKYNNEIFVSLHGKIMNEYPKVFNDCNKSYHCLGDVEDDAFINNPGTGVLLFDNSKYNIPMDIFERHGMADLCVSLFCQKENIPIICRKHKKDELHHILNENTLFERRFDLNGDHQLILQKIGKWELFKK